MYFEEIKFLYFNELIICKLTNYNKNLKIYQVQPIVKLNRITLYLYFELK